MMIIMDRLTTMRSFALVAREGSFAAAARVLGLSRANVTRHVADLEAHLGVRLLDRTTRAVRPSAVGVAYLPSCLDALAGVEAADAIARGEGERIGGTLRLSAPVSWGRAMLPKVISSLGRDHPKLGLDIRLTDRRVDLVREGVDLAVRIGQAPKEASAAELGHAALNVVAAPGYLAQYGTPQRPIDLKDHTCILYLLAREPAVWQLGTETVRVHSKHAFNNGDLLMSAVEAGLGLALQPDFVTRDALARGAAVRVLENHVAPSLPINALFQPGDRSSRIETVLEAIREECRR